MKERKQSEARVSTLNNATKMNTSYLDVTLALCEITNRHHITEEIREEGGGI